MPGYLLIPTLLLLLFPDGRPPSRRWRPLVPATLFFIACASVDRRYRSRDGHLDVFVELMGGGLSGFLIGRALDDVLVNVPVGDPDDPLPPSLGGAQGPVGGQGPAGRRVFSWPTTRSTIGCGPV